MSFWPPPLMSVLVNRSGPGFALGMTTLGDAPKVPVTFTDWLVAAEPPVELAAGLLDEELQPATATAASSGMMTSADARRMSGSLLSPSSGDASGDTGGRPPGG